MSLSAFFKQNVVSDITVDFVVSDRMKDKDGNPIPWQLKTMTEEENERLRKSATKQVKGKNGVKTNETDSEAYIAKLVVASVLYPDLQNAELQESYNVRGADVLIKKMLLPGEFASLVGKVQELNGFDRDLNELVEEVKN
ncbi:Phage XkdN-like tail assembly chaperone protein, TAC [Paenibacillus algorifonticola]|uniref:Phage XkdN-like tail assembly chaperone protein, TAC n=2 Tax=Paenibacillus algorifonticola TaxID=684063 RepID=A0A1I2H2W9_9BACL|nr:phage portal protein [Paenibacillus algorifonticola]SFF23146.1 Phage XkdN-like tail assembly chaperone protein, TAC [Paenibacillus algorifonticola]